MRTLPLSKAAYVVLDSSGNGTAELGPVYPGEQWQVASVAVSASSNANEALCRVYMGSMASGSSFIGGTTWGSTGDSTDNTTGAPLAPGQQVFAMWYGGDPGAEAVVRVTGTRTLP